MQVKQTKDKGLLLNIQPEKPSMLEFKCVNTRNVKMQLHSSYIYEKKSALFIT